MSTQKSWLSFLAYGAGGAFIGGIIAGAFGIKSFFWVIIISLFFSGIAYSISLWEQNKEATFLAGGSNILSRVLWTIVGALPLFGFTGVFGLIGYFIAR